jgi:anaerobic ribonucleoside-triphosphate reductase activating protein
VQTARFEAKTTVEGPGERSALWLQGCSIRCPDCCNPELQDCGAGVTVLPADLARKIIAAGADGLTLLGGEPLDQADELYEMLVLLRQASYQGIIMFSGYEWGEIAACPDRMRVASLCDLVIAGRFDKKFSPGNRRWIGSDNQTLHFITSFYDDLKQSWPKNVREIEIFIRDGVIMVNGTPLEPEHELRRMLGI